DVLVGINLLREGLDLPEVSAVAILDADKEGFLRSETSLIQTIGRTARNINAAVFMYGDRITNSMQKAIDETQRRRKIQLEYNKKHNIKPETIKKEIRKGLLEQVKARDTAQKAVKLNNNEYEKVEMVGQLEKEMFQAAEMLDFERATALRDKLKELKDLPQLSNFKKDKIKKKVRKK
ncbi:MAG: UvrB/UvrC motif-containing protein, partial [Planctomycetes bacterium]|nr:UvrB/UvrC motif-containing protein [Planctomycetota bacterium]